jgi:hypothetical protein
VSAEFEHLVVDISYASLRVIAQAVRAVVGGTLDMTVQTELQNFANECDNRIQHHERDVRREQIAALNAEHKATPVLHIAVVEESLDDLI